MRVRIPRASGSGSAVRVAVGNFGPSDSGARAGRPHTVDDALGLFADCETASERRKGGRLRRGCATLAPFTGRLPDRPRPRMTVTERG